MTYSIVARCPDTGVLGIAIATCLPAVGRIARFVEPGTGVVASQARLLPAHGTRVLEGMRGGASPADALAASLAADEDAAHRQVGVVAADGTAAAHTGPSCIPHAGHVTGDGFSAQANMMASPGVPEAMAAAYSGARGQHLALRLLDALDAAERLGGDIRGRQSAALHVRGPAGSGDLLAGVLAEVRVDDDPEPLVPLRRLVGLELGWAEGSAAAELAGAGDLAAADRRHREALGLAPQDPQPTFWYAVSLAGHGHPEEGAAAWARLAGHGGVGRWVDLLERMLGAGLVPEAAGSLLARGQTRS